MTKLNLIATIPDSSEGERLDRALSIIWPDYSRAQLKQWILAGNVTLENDIITVPRHKVRGGQQVALNAQLMAQTAWTAEKLPLDIVYEDDDIIIINKTANCIVHPGAGNATGTLINGLLYHAPTLANVPRCGLIHRLDKDTTGLLVVAKTVAAHQHLSKAMLAREIKRHYAAVIQGVVIAGNTIDAPIGRHPIMRTKMAIAAQGRQAVTHYRVAERFRAHTLLDIELETGRTHQIRVHLLHQGYPIVGDRTYGKKIALENKISTDLQQSIRALTRQALHAKHLSLLHPTTAKPMQFDAPLPQDMLDLITALKLDQESFFLVGQTITYFQLGQHRPTIFERPHNVTVAPAKTTMIHLIYLFKLVIIPKEYSVTVSTYTKIGN